VWGSIRSWQRAALPKARSTTTSPAASSSSQPPLSKRAERFEGHWFREIFQQREPIARKVELLFTDAAKNFEASGFAKGCPVAAVTLDLARDAENLRAVCRAIFMTWQDIIAAGLDEVPQAERLEVAELILATLEGALIMSRADATKDSLLRSGRTLGDILGRKFKSDGVSVAGDIDGQRRK